MTVLRSVGTDAASNDRYRVLRSEAVACRVSTATSWPRPVRPFHRSETAKPTAASAAALASPMRNDVGSIGSASLVISTSAARCASQPAIGRMVRRNSLLMTGTLLSPIRTGTFPLQRAPGTRAPPSPAARRWVRRWRRQPRWRWLRLSGWWVSRRSTSRGMARAPRRGRGR